LQDFDFVIDEEDLFHAITAWQQLGSTAAARAHTNRVTASIWVVGWSGKTSTAITPPELLPPPVGRCGAFLEYTAQLV
jgi:hypothetical protein